MLTVLHILDLPLDPSRPPFLYFRLTITRRYALQLLTPASILAGIAGRNQIELDDVNEMGELFLDAKTSAAAIGESEKLAY